MIDVVTKVDPDMEASCSEDVNGVFYAPGTVLLENIGMRALSGVSIIRYESLPSPTHL